MKPNTVSELKKSHWRNFFKQNKAIRVLERGWEYVNVDGRHISAFAVIQKDFTLTVFALVLNDISVRQNVKTSSCHD